MEHSQEHIATLCAVGTVAIAAAGLALGTSDGDSYLIKPGKRKAPGTNTTAPSPITPHSQLPPTPPTSYSVGTGSGPTERFERRLSASILRRKTVRASVPSTAESTGTESRESSISRHGVLRSWASDKESTDLKEQRPSSSWLRRISSISRGSHASLASSSSRPDESPAGSRPSLRDLDQPNKLVKRSSSTRLLYADRDRPTLLRRPATSHQRSATLSGLSYSRPLTTDSAMSADYISRTSSWRPFFEPGYARKRHSSGGYGESYARTISTPPGCPPILLKGGSVEPRELQDLEQERPPASSPQGVQTGRRHKMRRTLGSVRRGVPQRHFTDPIVRLNKDEAYGRIVPATAFSNLSPLSNASAFEIDLPAGTPSFTSSPPVYSGAQHRFTVPKRLSVAPSDPTTTSSDNDMRVFTDDESMDFQSDTAYDSLATRATASSHSGFRPPKIETIFDEVSLDQHQAQSSVIEELMQRTTLDDFGGSSRGEKGPSTEIGMGISGIADHVRTREGSPDLASTPVKGQSFVGEDFVSTPVPRGKPRNGPSLGSSPLSMRPYPRSHHDEPELPRMMDLDDEEDIDWSPKPDADEAVSAECAAVTATAVPVMQIHSNQVSEEDLEAQPSTKRSSIFDWSEHHTFGSDQSNGISPRPKTVHGKQNNNPNRSRPPGRKSNAAMHLRSQSVPVNRDSLTESELPSSATKFGTWALGSKPVSEEWSDDFEFDDVDETHCVAGSAHNDTGSKHESVPSVKVPQSIMDRQQSVHVQFGQVREFMLLVEELKRLRARGLSLGLLESHSRQLWEDAASIIDLATLNEDDEIGPRPSSPGSADVFGEEALPSKRSSEEDATRSGDGGRPVNRRSISSPATPPSARARGESLQTKTFLQTIQQSRSGIESSPVERLRQPREKLPFDTQDLRNLVVRAGVITRALKDIVRKAEGVSLSPEKPANTFQEPVFQQIFEPPGSSPTPGSRKPGLPKSRSANSYLDGAGTSNDHDISQALNLTQAVEAN